MRPLPALLAVVAVSACSTAQVQKADKVQAEIVHLCAVGAPLASLDPAIGVYVTAACASEEAIATLALDPHTAAWLRDIIAKLEAKL